MRVAHAGAERTAKLACRQAGNRAEREPSHESCEARAFGQSAPERRGPLLDASRRGQIQTMAERLLPLTLRLVGWLGVGALLAMLAMAMGGCAMTSDVMDAGNGVYMISAHAAPIRGGAAGANKVAYADANKFCRAKGMHAVILNAAARDVYQGAAGGGGGSFSGGVFAAGNTDLWFRCAE
jgi:hypothetical protein